MKCFIDRIEEGTAVILFKGGGEAHIPVKLFPFNVKEGDWFDVDFKLDTAEKEKTKSRIRELQNKLKSKSR